MGECIICGTEVEGADICTFHEEDVLFTFTGDSPEHLVEGRYYDAVVDGFAEFGVFLNLGNGVTGLLHRNELDRRLESLDWAEGDTVCVQVTSVNENGNVDLGPSIRQSPEEFRGTLEHGAGDGPAPAPSPRDHGASFDWQPAADFTGGDAIDRTQVRALDRYLGTEVVLEGIVEDIHQTGGPTVFTLRDESGEVECAAFAGAGVRAYPEVSDGDVVRVVGSVEHRFGDHQLEVDRLERLDPSQSETVSDRVTDGAKLPGWIDTAPLVYDDAASAAIETDLREAAATIRRAVEAGSQLRIRHPVTVDGYVAAAAIERAIDRAIGSTGGATDGSHVRRRPVRSPEYDLDTAIRDITQLQRDDADEAFVILVGIGSTNPITEPFDLLETYDIGYYVIDTDNPHPKTLNRVKPLVNPWCGEGTFEIPSTTAIAVNVAALIDDDVRGDLGHLPAVVAEQDLPATAADLLERSRYDRDDIETMQRAIALEAYYQPWEDKRALVRDLLFERDPGFVEPIGEQFETKLDQAVETAIHNAEVHETNGTAFVVIDVEQFGNRFEFPPDRLLLRGLLDADAFEASVAVGVGSDYLEVYSRDRLSLRRVTDAIARSVPDGSVQLRGSDGAGRIRFLNGRRSDVAEAAVDAIEAALVT